MAQATVTGQFCPVCQSQDGEVSIGVARHDGTPYYLFDCKPCGKSYVTGMVCGPMPGLEDEYRRLVRLQLGTEV